MDTLSITQIQDGVAIEMIDTELERIWRNIRDPDTRADAKRTITLQIAVVPDTERDMAACDITVKSQLAAPIGVRAKLSIGSQGMSEYVSPQLEIGDRMNVVRIEGGDQ